MFLQRLTLLLHFPARACARDVAWGLWGYAVTTAVNALLEGRFLLPVSLVGSAGWPMGALEGAIDWFDLSLEVSAECDLKI